ncbi:MAG: rhomboid family intramembrane serine protease [Verrucomicrobiota bacterium]
MLEDRDYMRASGYGQNRWRTATATILIVNAVIFLVEAVARRQFPSVYLGLSWEGLSRGYIWQLLTFQFLHAGPLHLLLNSLGLFSFGFAVEQFLGVKRFLWLYLLSGVLGGLLQVMGQALLPGLMGSGMVVGASAGLFGLIAAFALMFPEHDLTVYILLVFPVTVSAKVLASVFLGISILGMILQATGIDRSNVAHGAHAGGMLGGWLLLRFFSWQSRRNLYQREQESKPAPRKEVKPETDFVSKEVDPILEKITQKGMQSLTASERKILDEAYKKMEKR